MFFSPALTRKWRSSSSTAQHLLPCQPSLLGEERRHRIPHLGVARELHPTISTSRRIGAVEYEAIGKRLKACTFAHGENAGFGVVDEIIRNARDRGGRFIRT